tara:strand:- start:217 stop:480 length:264 start_codon:yes stop_codon:yes gene_type:complete
MTEEQKQRALIRMHNSYRLPVGAKVVIEDWHWKDGAYNGKVATIKRIGSRGPGLAHYTVIDEDGEEHPIDSFFLMPLSLFNQLKETA